MPRTSGSDPQGRAHRLASPQRVGAAWLPAAALVLVGTAASAHPGGAQAHAVAHSFTGFDHWFVMVAVGLLAAELGGRARLWLPGVFLAAAMLAGGLGLAGLVPVPSGHAGSWLSAIGVAVGMAVGVGVVLGGRAPRPAVLAVVVAAGALQGLAHVAPSWSTLGAFSLGSAALHAVGLAAGTWLLARHRWAPVVAGSAVVVLAVAG